MERGQTLGCWTLRSTIALIRSVLLREPQKSKMHARSPHNGQRGLESFFDAPVIFRKKGFLIWALLLWGILAYTEQRFHCTQCGNISLFAWSLMNNKERSKPQVVSFQGDRQQEKLPCWWKPSCLLWACRCEHEHCSTMTEDTDSFPAFIAA